MLSRASMTGEVLEGHVRRMATRIEHRGPDDAGTWADAGAGVALGFRRLAILDLSAQGHQPMRSTSGRFTLVFNGRSTTFSRSAGNWSVQARHSGGIPTPR
jgi:asparagine synthase (glutamine-hydrolysing)